ncbi:unnamed protein product [Heligmosomoides polygyrus]|uniref:Transposable element Tc3 transposase-like DNA-binding HTH domain-containing protein n=1 Tax=Heligmosomoides polygyrus TaxID=6339 RepID=A0A183GN95_HELPZ|nr:unnamed protein product [Heligmosomoides polygyrus]
MEESQHLEDLLCSLNKMFDTFSDLSNSTASISQVKTELSLDAWRTTVRRVARQSGNVVRKSVKRTQTLTDHHKTERLQFTAEARRRGKRDNEDDDDGDWRCEDGARRRPRRTTTLHCPPPGS